MTVTKPRANIEMNKAAASLRHEQRTPRVLRLIVLRLLGLLHHKQTQNVPVKQFITENKNNNNKTPSRKINKSNLCFSDQSVAVFGAPNEGGTFLKRRNRENATCVLTGARGGGFAWTRLAVCARDLLHRHLLAEDLDVATARLVVDVRHAVGADRSLLRCGRPSALRSQGETNELKHKEHIGRAHAKKKVSRTIDNGLKLATTFI